MYDEFDNSDNVIKEQPTEDAGSPKPDEETVFDNKEQVEQENHVQNYGMYHMGYEQQPVPEPPKKKKSGYGKKIAICTSLALVFGVVGSAAFQATDYVGSKLFPQLESETKIEATGTVEKNNTSEGAAANNNTTGNMVAAVAGNSMPSIVAITNKSIQEIDNWFYGSQTQEAESSGSGIIIAKNDKELLIASNNHVVEGANALSVCFSVDVENQEDKVVEALVKGTDASNDLAVVAVKLEDIPSEVMSQIKIATIGSSADAEVGQWAIAIGNALGYGQSVTYGVISALDRQVSVETSTGTITNNLIQTDAAINFGNSGGALLNSSGELIGINSVKAASTGVEGMGYAIPIDTAKPILDDLMNQTTRIQVAENEQGFMGITLAEVSAEAMQVYSMPAGAFVKDVQAGSAAEKAGIMKGDIITKIENTTISSASELLTRMKYYKAGETINVTAQTAANGQYEEREVTVTLSKRSEAIQESEQQEQVPENNEQIPKIFNFDN